MAVVSLPPVLDLVTDDLGLSRAEAGLLTSLPLILFGVGAPWASRRGRHLGNDRALSLALLVLATGILVRSVGGWWTALAGTALAGLGIALANVMVPTILKRDLGPAAPRAMGLYTIGLTGGAAIASAGAAVLVHLGWGWRTTLASAAVPAFLALVAWLGRIRKRGGWTPDEPEGLSCAVQHRAVWRHRLAWYLSGYMGCQSLLFYALMAWMPVLLLESGVGRGLAGAMLAIYNLLGIVGAMAVSLFFGRRWGSRWLAAIAASSWAVGVVGLLVLPGAYLGWVVLLGVTHGLGISATFALVAEKSRDASRARDLSGMVQLVGYLVAAAGPVGLGWLRDRSGGWAPSLTTLACVALAMVLLGHLSSRSRARV